MTTPVENLATLFKNANGNVGVVLPSLTTVAFIQGRFFTPNKKLQAELQRCVDNSNEFGIFIDAREPEIDLDASSPMEQLRKKIRKELEEEMKAKHLIDAGTSTLTPEQAQASVAGTVDIGTTGAAELTEEERALREKTSQVAQPSGALSALQRLAGKN